jgi:hypothetical protein
MGGFLMRNSLILLIWRFRLRQHIKGKIRICGAKPGCVLRLEIAMNLAQHNVNQAGEIILTLP